MMTDYASLRGKLSSGQSKTSGYYNVEVSWTGLNQPGNTGGVFRIATATAITVPSRNWSETFAMGQYSSGARPQELPLTNQP
jgi:hypothetical protein